MRVRSVISLARRAIRSGIEMFSLCHRTRTYEHTRFVAIRACDEGFCILDVDRGYSAQCDYSPLGIHNKCTIFCQRSRMC